MNLEIKRLSPDLINDYINFLETDAFSDNHEWAGCYCVFYHWNDELEAESKACEACGEVGFRRRLAIDLIQKGLLQGYLAYLDGKVVGWCNANDKTGYESLNQAKFPELWEDYDPSRKVKMVVCYTIAPQMRRMGIATKMLLQVCEDAKAEGYTYVEAFPGTGEVTSRSYHGPYALYEKCGFIKYKDLDGMALVRKSL